MNATPIENETPYAVIEDYEMSGLAFVTVYAPTLEGSYQCVSHAPFSKQPSFADLSEAKKFAASFGVTEENINVHSHRAYAATIIY